MSLFPAHAPELVQFVQAPSVQRQTDFPRAHPAGAIALRQVLPHQVFLQLRGILQLAIVDGEEAAVGLLRRFSLIFPTLPAFGAPLRDPFFLAVHARVWD